MASQANMKVRPRADSYESAGMQARADPLTAAAQRFANSAPFLPELGAAWSAGLRSAGDLSAGRNVDISGRWNEARAEQQGYADEFQGEHPLVGNVLGALGMAVPAAIAAGAFPSSVRPSLPAPGVPGYALRAAGTLGKHATAGALASAAYGFSQPGTLDQRVRSGRNAFIPGAIGGALAPIALGGLGRAAAALRKAPAVAAAIQRVRDGTPMGRTVQDLAQATSIDPQAFAGHMTPLAQALKAKSRAAWSEANPLPAPVTTNRILEKPDVIHKFNTVMSNIEDDGREPTLDIPVANDYYSPIRGNLIPNFLLQLPTVEAVDATRRRLLDDVFQRYTASGRTTLEPEDRSLVGNARALETMLSEGPDLAGQAYRRAFGGSGDELSLRRAFHSAQGKLIDPMLDPDEHAAWFGALRPFEQEAARAAAASDLMSVVHAGRTDIVQSPLVQERMRTTFGPEAADLLGKLKLEDLAGSLRLPGAQVVRSVEPWDLGKFDAIPRTGSSANVALPQPTPATAILPAPLTAWSFQQAQGQQ